MSSLQCSMRRACTVGRCRCGARRPYPGASARQQDIKYIHHSTPAPPRDAARQRAAHRSPVTRATSTRPRVPSVELGAVRRRVWPREAFVRPLRSSSPNAPRRSPCAWRALAGIGQRASRRSPTHRVPRDRPSVRHVGRSRFGEASGLARRPRMRTVSPRAVSVCEHSGRTSHGRPRWRRRGYRRTSPVHEPHEELCLAARRWLSSRIRA